MQCSANPSLPLRWYSIATATLAAAFPALALLNLDHLGLVEVLLVAGYFFANLYQSALGGWLSTYNIPISHMLFVDGAGYASGGVASASLPAFCSVNNEN